MEAVSPIIVADEAIIAIGLNARFEDCPVPSPSRSGPGKPEAIRPCKPAPALMDIGLQEPLDDIDGGMSRC